MPKKKITRTVPSQRSIKYVDFLKSIHLAGIGLDAASITIDRQALMSALSSGTLEAPELHAEYKVILEDDNGFVIGAEYKLLLKKEQDKTEIGHISCNFSTLLTLKEKADKAFIERFSNTEAKLIFWPYLRHFVSDTAHRMSIPPILIPLTLEVTSEPKPE